MKLVYYKYRQGMAKPGAVPATYADIADLTRDIGFAPATPIEEGIPRFVQWYREFYKI